MRESLFERLKKEKISYIQEIKKINNLLHERYTDTQRYFLVAFKKSPFNIYYENFKEVMKDIIEINTTFYIDRYADINVIINCIIDFQAELTLDSFLNFLEFFRTLCDDDNEYFDINVNQIMLIILNDCEKLGYSFKKDDNNTYRVMLKHPEAESVAVNVKDSIRDKIYQYLMLRNGSVKEKRECIKSLADDVELTCKKYSNIEEYNKLKQFIQCIRHTKDNPKKEFPFYYKDEEKWLDNTFEMIIGILAFTKTKDIVKEIKNLESN